MKNNLANKEWWSAALVRAIKTVAQAAVATIGAAALIPRFYFLSINFVKFFIKSNDSYEFSLNP